MHRFGACARQPFEFGGKVSTAAAHKSGLVVGARSFAGNPYDGHTLAGQIEQTTTLQQDIAEKPKTVVVHLGYRGVDHLVPINTMLRGRCETISNQQSRWLERRQEIELTIGHAKQDHGTRRRCLKDRAREALHAALCEVGFKKRWLMRAITPVAGSPRLS